MISKSKSFKLNGHRLIKVFDDNTDSGDFMLLHPEDRWKAADYIADGFEVASIYETPDDNEDMVEINNDISEHPYKIGYLILNKHTTVVVNKYGYNI